MLPVLVQGSLEFGSRVAGYTELALERFVKGRVSYESTSWDAALEDLELHLGSVAEILAEPGLEEIEEHTRRLLRDISREDPYVPRWAVDSVLARCCYLACRLLRPEVVVETGVAYGVSSAFILKALQENGRGALHSIDLPPLRLGSDRFQGISVPETLRERWSIYRGASARVLPGLLEELGQVDLFLHDSLHTHRNMRREFSTVWPRLPEGGVLLADDVERNHAFQELEGRNPRLWSVVSGRERRPLSGKAAPVTFGIAIK